MGGTSASTLPRDNGTNWQLESCGDLPGRPRGDITTYASIPQGGNCGLDWNHLRSSKAWSHFAALPRVGAESYNQGLACGACVKLRCSCNQNQFKGACNNGHEITVMITDSCPECKAGDIDLGSNAWRDVTGGAGPSR